MEFRHALSSGNISNFINLSDQFHQNTFETIRREDSKLRTYAVFKNEIGFEIGYYVPPEKNTVSCEVFFL